jgi:tetratricopeptide (TPR) repeat protein
VTYFEKKDYRSAAQYLEKSVALKLRYNLSEIALPYLNLAKTYAKTGNPERAQRYFQESIASFIREFGQYYYRLAEVYFDYGLFL